MFSTASGRLYTLDGMRGLAAIAVGLYHFDHVGLPLMPAGYLAVDFFFGLSGLVIGLAYEQRLRAGMGIGDFTARRVIRLYPLYLVGSLLGLAALVAGTPLTSAGDFSIHGALRAAGPALLMLPNPATVLLYPANGPAWSLLFELLVNVAFAAVLVRLRTRWLLVTAAVSLLLFYGLVRHHGATNLGVAWMHFGGGAARVTFGFTVGLICGRCAARPSRPTSWWLLLPVTGLLAALAVQPSRPTDMLTIAALFPAILVVASRVELPPAAASWCEWLGDLSYPFYVVHFAVLSLWVALLRPFHVPAWALVGGFVVVTTMLARSLVGWDVRVPRRLTELWAARRLRKAERG